MFPQPGWKSPVYSLSLHIYSEISSGDQQTEPQDLAPAVVFACLSAPSVPRQGTSRTILLEGRASLGAATRLLWQLPARQRTFASRRPLGILKKTFDRRECQIGPVGSVYGTHHEGWRHMRSGRSPVGTGWPIGQHAVIYADPKSAHATEAGPRISSFGEAMCS